MRVAIIVPYFGHFPNYYQLFLDSCGYNPEFDWIILSDDTSEYRYPDNVHFFATTWDSLKEKIQSCFEFKISLSKPQKLCDYKCAYGLIFEDMLTDYDWWGYCDLDQIFGCLSNFITEEMLLKYVKIGSIGHLTLYRNTAVNNRVFMLPINGRIRYKEVFTTDTGCAFDEWLPGNVNEIYINCEKNVYLQNSGADLNPYRTLFQTVDYDINNQRYTHAPIKNSIFYWNNGILFQIFKDQMGLQHIEFPYVHLQKRIMTDCRKNTNGSNYYIIPNCFLEDNLKPEKLLRVAALHGLVNTQFIKVKWKSLLYRLRNNDWTFSNVFK